MCKIEWNENENVMAQFKMDQKKKLSLSIHYETDFSKIRSHLFHQEGCDFGSLSEIDI